MEIYNEKERFDNYLSTTLLSHEYSLRWTFENFSKYFSISDDASTLESNYFQMDSNINWTVKTQKDHSGWFIYIYAYFIFGNSVDLEWKLSVLNENNKILHEASAQLVLRKQPGYTYCLITESDLKKINESKTSDTVILVIFLKIIIPETKTLFEYPHLSKDVQRSFSEELVKMYDNQLSTDITFKVQGETVGAHKTILIARSPVFAKMLQQEMAESQNQVVDILDIRMATLKELLAFIYSRSRHDYDLETTLDLYYAADKYEVLELKELCGFFLTRLLDSENVIQILQLADRHGDTGLKDKALQFLRLYFTKCVESENWIEFQNGKSELYKEVVKSLKN